MRQSDWASVFSSLPNTAFFEVVRHYLGPVSTPFHKPDLIAKLTAFLKRDDVIRRSLDFIDEEDAQVLSCIDLYPHPTEKTLKCVLPNIRPLALQEKLINLEERLLIIKEWKSGDSFFSLTPLGIEAWRSGILGPGVILGKPLGLIKRSIEPWYDDNFLNSALSFLLESHPLFRIEGGWRKKTLKLLKQRFPGLFHDHLGEERLLLAGRGIIETGLAEREAGRLEAALKAWRDMEGLSRDKRRIVMIAGAIQERGLSRYIAIQIARTFTECLPAGKVYALDKMTSLLQIIVGGQYPMSPKAALRILSHLVLLGELVPGKGTGLGRPQPRQPAGDRCLDITPAGDIICHPGLPLFCDLALSAEPVSNDIVTSYRLEKNRFIGGLNTGIDTQSLVRQIEEHSGQPLPGNIATLLSEWETEFRAVSFRFAVVLQAKGRHRKLLEETGAPETPGHQSSGGGCVAA